jgi:hypothetical protein
MTMNSLFPSSISPVLGRLLVLVDNEELATTDVQAAVQILTRTTGMQVSVENPNFMGEMIDPQVVMVRTTPAHVAKVQAAIHMTLLRASVKVPVGLLLADPEADTGGAQEVEPNVGGGKTGGSLLGAPVATGGPSGKTPKAAKGAVYSPLAAETAPNGQTQLVPDVQPVNLSPVTNPELAIWNIDKLKAASPAIVAEMKKRGYTTVGVLRDLTEEELREVPGIGTRLAQKIVCELAEELPPRAVVEVNPSMADAENPDHTTNP